LESISLRHNREINKSIDITLVNTPAKKAPKKANFLAQENQVGAGELAKN